MNAAMVAERRRYAKRYTTGGRWAPPPRREAANDNTPPVLDELAARRAYVASLPEWDGRTVKAWPTGTRLLRARKFEDLEALEHWRDAMGIPRIIAVNDNQPETDEDGEPVPVPIDSSTEITPSVRMMLECAGRGSCDIHPSSRMVEAAPAWRPTVVRFSAFRDEAVIRLGDLRFDRLGKLMSYRNSRGHWCPPTERYTDPKGCKDCEIDAVSGIRLSTAEFAASPEDELAPVRA